VVTEDVDVLFFEHGGFWCGAVRCGAVLMLCLCSRALDAKVFSGAPLYCGAGGNRPPRGIWTLSTRSRSSVLRRVGIKKSP